MILTQVSYFIPYKAIFDSEIIDTNKLEFVDVEPSEKQNAVQNMIFYLLVHLKLLKKLQ